jgi:hypothetical protein
MYRYKIQFSVAEEVNKEELYKILTLIEKTFDVDHTEVGHKKIDPEGSYRV